MARRRKQQSPLEVALKEDWKVSATFAAGIFLITFLVMPAITNTLLKGIVMVLRPLGLFLMAVFGLIAAFKYFGQKRSVPKSGFQIKDIPIESAKWSDESSRATRAMEKSFFASNSPKINNFLQRPGEWSLKLVQDIEWKKFEELSTAYYIEKGIKAEATSLGADGGIDIKLYQDDSGKPTSIVQCKAWNSRFVGVKEIREFLGVMSHEKIAKGFYMASGKYSDDAIEIAKANRITLITGEMLLMMITRLPEGSQRRLLELATEGDYMTPSCPSCGIKMIKRLGKRGEFWGCKNYPKCRQMLHVKKS